MNSERPSPLLHFDPSTPAIRKTRHEDVRQARLERAFWAMPLPFSAGISGYSNSPDAVLAAGDGFRSPQCPRYGHSRPLSPKLRPGFLYLDIRLGNSMGPLPLVSACIGGDPSPLTSLATAPSPRIVPSSRHRRQGPEFVRGCNSLPYAGPTPARTPTTAATTCD